MFLIRQVYDDTTPANAGAIAQVQKILVTQFPGLEAADIAKVPAMLRDPMKYRFRAILLVGEKGQDNVQGFAFLLHAPDLHFAYLEYVSAAPGATGGGFGGALYERAREEANALGCVGLFFECLPDDPALSPDAGIRKQNAARLRFYERYGAFPVVNTAYETPLTEGDSDPPYLVFDPLGRQEPLSRKSARAMVRAILERKYGDVCPESYIAMVTESFEDDPVRFRLPRYIKTGAAAPVPKAPVPERRIALAVNASHAIHHVRERGYVESPVRIPSILGEILKTGLFEEVRVRHFGDRHLEEVHDRAYLAYLKRACQLVPDGKSVYPYVFPIRNAARPPKDLPLRAGYYCIDTFTPLNGNAYKAARGAADCALTCAEEVLGGYHLAYALVRPPGHHAERRSFGGFCYFNSAAIAAQYLSRYGRVALLDVDYHHGNGAEDIFYERDDILTLSLHGHPRHTYPYFSGFEEDNGAGAGEGFNLNFPMPEGLDGIRYRRYLTRALKAVRLFDPHFLVLALGLDPAKGDPTGSFTLGAKDFKENGRMIGTLNLPTLVVQEGGYRTRSLGVNARNFFEGLWEAAHGLGAGSPPAGVGPKQAPA